MANTYYTVLTDAGAAKLANSQITGTALQWTAMALGDGNGSTVVPDSSVTALKNEVYRANLNTLKYDSDDPTQIIAEMVVLPQDGGFTIREVGIYDSDGDLVVYGNYPEVVVPKLAEGSGVTLTAVVRAAVGSDSNITLKIDPTAVIATRQWADDEIDSKISTHDALATAHSAAISSQVPSLSLTVDDTYTPTANADTVNNLINSLANRIKAAGGLTDWKSDPSTTLSALATFVSECASGDDVVWSGSNFTNTKLGISGLMAQNGYISFGPNFGNLVIQWGSSSTVDGIATFVYPISMTNKPYMILSNGGLGAQTSSDIMLTVLKTGSTNTQCDIQTDSTLTGSSVGVIVIGK